MANCSDLYVDEGYWDDGYVYTYEGFPILSWAENNPTTQILPSYLYQQYQPDDNVESFFKAYNTSAQATLNYLVGLNLPVWLSPNIQGYLLDWVGGSLYGFKRPILTFPAGSLIGGMFNTAQFNTLPFNQAILASGSQTQLVNDDIYKRCLSWNLYKGDGFQYSTRWLKNRVYRFLSQTATCYYDVTDTYPIGINYTSETDIEIVIDSNFLPNSMLPTILQAAIIAQVLHLPFQYNYTVSL